MFDWVDYEISAREEKQLQQVLTQFVTDNVDSVTYLIDEHEYTAVSVPWTKASEAALKRIRKNWVFGPVTPFLIHQTPVGETPNGESPISEIIGYHGCRWEITVISSWLYRWSCACVYNNKRDIREFLQEPDLQQEFATKPDERRNVLEKNIVSAVIRCVPCQTQINLQVHENIIPKNICGLIFAKDKTKMIVTCLKIFESQGHASPSFLPTPSSKGPARWVRTGAERRVITAPLARS